MPRIPRNRCFTPRALIEGLKAKSKSRREERKRLAEADGALGHLRNDLTPKLELVERNIADLMAPKRNVRKLDEAHVGRIAASIPLTTEQQLSAEYRLCTA